MQTLIISISYIVFGITWWFLPDEFFQSTIITFDKWLIFIILSSTANYIILRSYKIKVISNKTIKEQYAGLVDTTLDGYWLVNSKGNFIDVNNNYCRLSGYSKDELLKLGITDIEASETPEETENHIKKVIEKGADRFETKHKTKDGKIWDAEISTVYLRAKEQFVVFIRDISERKRMVNELQLKENAISNSINAVVMCDQNGIINYVNKSFLKMWGYDSESEILYKDSSSFVEHPEKAHDVIVHLKKYGNWIGELTALRKDWTKFVARITASVVKDEKGNISRMYASIIDMTEHKKYEKEIYKLTQAVEQNPVSIIITDPKGNIEYVNKKFIEMTGFSREEVINKNPRILQSGLTSKEMYKSMWKSLIEGKEWHGEIQNKKKDGSYYWQILILSPIRDVDGKIIHYLAIQRDITDRKNLEEELSKYREHLEDLVEKRTIELSASEEKFRALAANSEDAIMRFDRFNRHLYTNPIAFKMTAIPPESFIGKTHRELGFPNYLVDLWEEAIQKVFISKTKSRIEFQLPNGIWIDWILVPEFDKNGSVYTIITSGRDITLIKEYEKRIEESLQKEKKINELKSKFISTASHEFRTPLTAIQSSAQMIKRYSHKWNKEKLDEHYNRIDESISYLTQLMDDVLTISRSENEKNILQPELINLDEFLKMFLENINYIKGTKHEIIYDSSISGKMFMLDNKLFKSIINNLLSNAIKYSPDGGKVEIKIEQIENDLIIKVKDEGIGIPQDEIDFIFNSFYRTKNAMNITGTGLGLDIVKRAVELHKGTISVASKIEHGTEFTIKIPL